MVSKGTDTSASGHVKSTSKPERHTQKTLDTNQSIQTPPKSTQENSQTLTSSQQASRARHLVLQADKVDSMTTEVTSFLKLLGLQGKRNHAIYSLRTSETSSATTTKTTLDNKKVTPSKPSFEPLMTWGMMLNGSVLTARCMYHKTGNVSSLSGILEANVPKEYFLSERATQNLMNHKEKHKAKGNGFGTHIAKRDSDKVHTIDATYYKGGHGSMIAEKESKVVNIQTSGRGNGKVETRVREGFGQVGRGSGGNTRQQKTLVMEKVFDGSQGMRVYNTNGTSVSLNAHGGGQGAKTGLYVIPVLTPDRAKKRQNGRRFKKDGEPAFTITAVDKHGVMIGSDGENYKIRRLTPLECERLQGFDDYWTLSQYKGKPMSDSQRYAQCGNAVTVDVIQYIGSFLK